jgi:DNA-directed RNA polymerases I, II, and III subunit RPABC3
MRSSEPSSTLQELHGKQPKPSAMDAFEYVMHGKVYKLDKKTGDGAVRAVVNISFGGLLLQLIGDHNKLSYFELDSMVYLLVRRAM